MRFFRSVMIRATVTDTIISAVNAREVGIKEEASGNCIAVEATSPPMVKQKMALRFTKENVDREGAAPAKLPWPTK